MPLYHLLVSSYYFINVCSPAHSLHHVCDQEVRDTRAWLLCQVKSILQLLYGTHSTSTSPPLLLQLKTKLTLNSITYRAYHNSLHFITGLSAAAMIRSTKLTTGLLRYFDNISPYVPLHIVRVRSDVHTVDFQDWQPHLLTGVWKCFRTAAYTQSNRTRAPMVFCTWCL